VGQEPTIIVSDRRHLPVFLQRREMRRTPPNEHFESAPHYDTSMSSENDKNLISFIATTVEGLRARVETLSDQMATISDQMVTKVDFANFEDRMIADLENRMAALEDRMATKEDLAKLEKRVAAVEEQMATKDDLSRLATVVRGDFEQVHFRFDTLERVMSTRFGQVETDISRLRSVLYLLVKDKPDMLRLLGQPTPSERQP
jgi:hypothetical protein